MNTKRTKILVTAAILLIIACIYTAFLVKNSPTPKNTHNTVVTLNVTKTIKDEIDNVVLRTQYIEAIQIVTVNFQRNIRTDTYMSIKNDAIQLIYDTYIHNKIAETPLFTSDKNNNSRLLKLINGEFICVPFEQSTAYTYAPSAKKFVEYACAMGIPPLSNGEFTGIITVYLNKIPTDDERRTMYLLCRDLSLKIHEDNTILNGNKFKFGLGLN